MPASRSVQYALVLLLLGAAGTAGAQGTDPNSEPLYPSQWPLHNTGQEFPQGCSPPVCRSGTPDADIDWPETWDAGITGEGVIVAIGTPNSVLTVECAHPDIAARLWVNPGEGPTPNGADDDGNGFIDDIHGANFGSGDGDVCAPLAGGADHDTDVARLILGDVNGIDMAGVAPGARLMILAGWLDGQNKDFYTDALPYAEARGARIVVVPYEGVPDDDGASYPISSSAECSSFATQYGLNRSSVLAASQVLVLWGFSDQYPGCDPSAVGLSYTRSDDAAFTTPGDPTNLGNAFIDMAAPGERGYVRGIALSWALPIAGGVGALALEASAGLTRAELKARLENSADKVGPNPYDPSGRNDRYGFGRLNAFTAAQQGDLDGDGIDADGDLSGVVGDGPCPPGGGVGCDDICPAIFDPAQVDGDGDGDGDGCDNCPDLPNGDQSDAGGIGGPVADGIGDVCQCGDSSGDGIVDARDVTATQLCAVGLGVCRPTCDADSDSDCDANDVPPVEGALAGGPGPSCLL